MLKRKLSAMLGGMSDKKMKINIVGEMPLLACCSFLNPISSLCVGVAGGAFLNNDKATLAFYNIGPNTALQVGEKTRGGRK